MDIRSIREKVSKLRSVKSLSKIANEIGVKFGKSTTVETLKKKINTKLSDIHYKNVKQHEKLIRDYNKARNKMLKSFPKEYQKSTVFMNYLTKGKPIRFSSNDDILIGGTDYREIHSTWDSFTNYGKDYKTDDIEVVKGLIQNDIKQMEDITYKKQLEQLRKEAIERIEEQIFNLDIEYQEAVTINYEGIINKFDIAQCLAVIQFTDTEQIFDSDTLYTRGVYKNKDNINKIIKDLLDKCKGYKIKHFTN